MPDFLPFQNSSDRAVFATENLPQPVTQGVTEADVLITAELAHRPARQPDLAAENEALRTVAQHLLDEPQVLLKTLVRTALDLCQADTVGVSLLETAPNGELVFRWVAIAGALESLEQTTAPADFSPCGTTLARNQPQLYCHPERYFTCLQHPQFPVTEGLLVPLCAGDRALGTLWILSHHETRQFDAEDQRLMVNLGSFTASALHKMQQLYQETTTALRQSEALNQQILDSSDDCIKVLDLEGRILFMNRGGQTLLGIQNITPFLNASWIEFWEGADQRAAMAAIARARAGEICTFQGYRPTLSGEPKWWDTKVSPMRGAGRQVERLLCISRDITESRQVKADRQQAEENLQESEERYRAIVNQAITGVAYTNLEGRLTLVNQKYCDMTGYSAAELSQLRMHEITHPEDLPRNVELYNRMVADGVPFEIEKRYIRKDGSIVWVNNHVSLVRDRDGNPQSVVAIVLDITDRKRREANAAFLAEITDDFSRLSTADEIMQAVGAKLGKFLNLPHCYFMSIDEVRDEVVLLDRWNAEGMPQLPDTICLSEQVSADFYALVYAGETVVSNNTQVNPITNAEANAEIQVISFITVPFHQNGEWKYLFSVHDIDPRNWREDEVELVSEFANRLFPRLERARTEDALRKSEEKYRSLFESIDEGFCLIEVLFNEAGKAYDYRFLEANPAFEKHTGLVGAIGKTVRELVPQHEAHWFEIYGEIVKTGRPARFQNAAEEMGRFYDVYAFRVGEPHEHKVAVLFNDISDRKQAEVEREQLLANERQYANQLQGLTAAALAINSALSVEEVLRTITDQAAAIIGTHQAVTSMTIDQNWAQGINAVYLSDKYAQWRGYEEKPDGSGIYACVCYLNRSMRMTQAELEAHPRWKGFSHAADKHPPMRGWLAAPLMGRDGHNIGLIQLSDKYEGEFTSSDESILVQLAQMASVAVENARLYEAEQQARSVAEAAREEAQAANRVKDEFLAVLSHELRSPLNPILGWSTLLQRNKLDAAKTAQALATIQRNAKLQSELIEDLLDVSRILRGKLNLTVAPVDLASTIREAMETVRLAAEAKSITVEANAPDVGLVSGDSTRLQQVIWNLLSNAVKFTPEGGQVNIQLKRENGYAQITVTDTGQGIAPEFVPYVFDYFRQANSATTRKFGGLGLGLAIVRHLVELHGGTVQAASPGVGMGATFTVRLPLMSQQSTTRQNSSLLEPTSDLSGIRVLVVDDDPDSREFVAFVLEQAGAQVTLATTAYEALSRLMQSQPDVLLSDIGMPDMDGYMLLQQVRALPPEQGGQVPAIALTAYAGDFNQQQALTAGFQQHIPKPIEPEELIQVISNLVVSQR
jgi:PAS domain S-box-containing protein